MSTVARWANKNVLTIWRASDTDDYGRVTYSAPEYVLASYREGGSDSYNDKFGVSFVPKSIYWTEMLSEDGETFLEKPDYTDKVLLGKFTGLPDPTASDVKSITVDDAKMFGSSQMPDYIIGV